jgi:DNA-binding transcriptional ArsR family regulator
VAESSLTADADAPPARLLALTRALGDERRLRVLRALARREASLADLSAVFGLPKTTMHHHLAILREAGLIRLRSNDNRYRLRREVFPLVSELLVDYLEEDDHAL